MGKLPTEVHLGRGSSMATDSEQEKQMQQPVLVRGEIRATVRRGRRPESRQVLAPKGEEIWAGSHERGGWV